MRARRSLDSAVGQHLKTPSLSPAKFVEKRVGRRNDGDGLPTTKGREDRRRGIPAPPTPTVWSLVEEDKLILIRENLTWSEALRYCRQNHVDLVSVNSEEMQRRVRNVVKRASTATVWLGLRHSCIVGIWFWVSGETVCYQNWVPGNGTSEEDCEHAVRSGAVQSGGDQRWISRPEHHKLNFICSRY
ncbi:hypothetical protein G5714_004255 [Onychostoma macrolepis]|uniref:C-type lectin domain-containing protein n=1 Tax=Onychostoma macrolepis TaxID=369639 RepID=A0A7J6D4C2_9TELE|nr:hypothetical protein G5714_004255 [Onychostoma macrolepis]